MDKKTETLQFRISPEMKEKLKALAESRGVSVTALIEDCLQSAIREKVPLESRVLAVETDLKRLIELHRNELPRKQHPA